MVVLDATALSLLLNPDAFPPQDPETGEPVSHARERLGYLQQELQRAGETILLPTPALAEVLVGLGDAGPSALERINRSGRFKIADFDQRAAIEVAAMTREAIRSGDKKAGSTEPWQKIKVDRQIIAIARVNGAQRIYSDDRNLGNFAAAVGVPVVRTWELPLPPAAQSNLFD